MVKDNVEDVKDDVEDVKGDVKEVKGDVGDVRGQMAMIAAFLAKKFPGEICRNEVDSPGVGLDASCRGLHESPDPVPAMLGVVGSGNDPPR